MEEVEIEFQRQSLLAKFGSKPRKVTLEVAQSYERKGWAKIKRSFPDANPAPNLDQTYGGRTEVPVERVSFMPEDRLIDLISWITSASIPYLYKKQAEDVGLKFTQVGTQDFSVGNLVLAKLIVLSSDLSGFEEDKKRHIRAVLFQKKIPFVYRVETPYDPAEYKWIRQIITEAKGVFFSEKKYLNSYSEPCGEFLQDWTVEKSAINFWRKINEILKGLE